MEKVLQIEQHLLRRKRLPAAVIALTLVVLAATILLATLNLRLQTRRQILSRDGEALQTVSLFQQYEDEAHQETLRSLEDTGEQFNHILKISRLKGVVLGVRLFTRDGLFTNAFPANISEAVLPPGDLEELKALRPVSHFDAHASLASIDLLAGLQDPPPKPVPLLEVNVPLQDKDKGRLVGVAQFILHGESIAREFSLLDRNLALYASVAFIVAGGILTAAILLSFRAVHRANRLLAAQAQRLLRANQQLTLAAKTSAVGAVTSHLIHGLKNPLTGLQGFVQTRGQGQSDGAASESDWKDAVASAQRMQALISGVVRILEEQQTGGHYEISLHELVEIISARMLPVARASGIHFFSQLRAEGTLGNREANLAILILENLIQNAFQVSREGKAVRLTVSQNSDNIHCEVQDEGPGFPEELKDKLFSPCRSTKAGGSGIGLAISRQLALNIGADLQLKSSSSRGCVFCLSLPQKLTLPAFAAAGLVPD